MDIDNLTIAQLMANLKLAAQKCPRCEGTRETVFTARGRDNIVNCLECEPIYQILEHLEAALKLLKAIAI
jgi:uncharacterized Zn finger protein